jgi:hypothetical protein
VLLGVDDAVFDEETSTFGAGAGDELGWHGGQVEGGALVDEPLALVGRQLLQFDCSSNLSGVYAETLEPPIVMLVVSTVSDSARCEHCLATSGIASARMSLRIHLAHLRSS